MTKSLLAYFSLVALIHCTSSLCEKGDVLILEIFEFYTCVKLDYQSLEKLKNPL